MDAEVIIVGAGIAGLTCARRLEENGQAALIVEASDDVGGRVRTDEIDGFLVDRGFQVFLQAYPEARRFLDYDALDLRAFKPGALIWTGERFERAVDPRQDLIAGIKSAGAHFGRLSDKARLAKLWSQLDWLDNEGISSAVEPKSTREALEEYGFGPEIIQRFLRPLFAGAMVDPRLENSSVLFDFIFRMFGAGKTSVPAHGMRAIPRQLAAKLTHSDIRLQSPVERVDRGRVTLESGEELTADHVVVATDGPAACELLGELDTCRMRPSTTVYFTADEPPYDEHLLALDGTGVGPINSLTVLTNVAPEYAPAGQVLISASVLGVPDDEKKLVARCRAQLSRWFDDVGGWEHLRTYVIERSLPAQTPDIMPPVHKSVEIDDGLYVCGDHRDTASINGAMLSGRRVAETIMDIEARVPSGQRPERRG